MAEQWCQRSINGWRRLKEEHHPGYFTSLRLMVFIHEKKGEVEKAARSPDLASTIQIRVDGELDLSNFIGGNADIILGEVEEYYRKSSGWTSQRLSEEDKTRAQIDSFSSLFSSKASGVPLVKAEPEVVHHKGMQTCTCSDCQRMNTTRLLPLRSGPSRDSDQRQKPGLAIAAAQAREGVQPLENHHSHSKLNGFIPEFEALHSDGSGQRMTMSIIDGENASSGKPIGIEGLQSDKPSDKQNLSRALAKAKQAVALDLESSHRGAIEAYQESCVLPQESITGRSSRGRSAGQEEIRIGNPRLSSNLNTDEIMHSRDVARSAVRKADTEIRRSKDRENIPKIYENMGMKALDAFQCLGRKNRWRRIRRKIKIYVLWGLEHGASPPPQLWSLRKPFEFLGKEEATLCDRVKTICEEYSGQAWNW